MIRSLLLPAAAATLLLAAVPALADPNGSTEQQQVPRECSATPDNRYSPPGPQDCQEGEATYLATYYSNDVRCGDSNQVVRQQGVSVYAGGDPTTSGGSAGTCSDGEGAAAAPVQGRAGLSGSTGSGARAVVDGDRDNGNETAQGYVAVEKGAGAQAPTYYCGDEHAQQGRADSDAPQKDRDTAAECGSGT